MYKGKHLDTELRLDVLADNVIGVELKAVETLHPLYDAQLLTFMKLSQKPKGVAYKFQLDQYFQRRTENNG